MKNAHFLRLGLPPDVCGALVNPGFFDPFDPDSDITLDNPAYRWAAIGRGYRWAIGTGLLSWCAAACLNWVAAVPQGPPDAACEGSPPANEAFSAPRPLTHT
jgi:hypothetical protein